MRTLASASAAVSTGGPVFRIPFIGAWLKQMVVEVLLDDLSRHGPIWCAIELSKRRESAQ